MRRFINTYKWIALVMMTVWSVNLFSGTTHRQTSSPFSYTLVQGKTAPAVMPFKSTSAYPSVVGESNIFSSEEEDAPIGSPVPYYVPSRARMESWGSMDEDEYPTGVIPNPAPVGEPLVLMIMAGMFMVYIYRREKSHTC